MSVKTISNINLVYLGLMRQFSFGLLEEVSNFSQTFFEIFPTRFQASLTLYHFNIDQCAR
eukprot:JP437391.1.p4 GENE.JP437391.1~~JP437391.1.p4  ORF type:complete len:60 (+),score=0.92 JP437391.1:255-434(+)